MTNGAVPTLSAPPAIVDALLAGEQIVDLRTGPGAGGLPAGVTRGWLLADPEADPELKPAYRRARELSLPGAGDVDGAVRIDGWVELAGSATVRLDDGVRAALDGRTVLSLDALAGEEVLVLALRAHRLVEPLTDPADLPADPAAGPPSEPALSDTAFDARRNGLAGALPAGLTPPP